MLNNIAGKNNLLGWLYSAMFWRLIYTGYTFRFFFFFGVLYRVEHDKNASNLPWFWIELLRKMPSVTSVL